jgi:hypothetical protein
MFLRTVLRATSSTLPAVSAVSAVPAVPAVPAVSAVPIAPAVRTRAMPAFAARMQQYRAVATASAERFFIFVVLRSSVEFQQQLLTFKFK